MGIHYGDGFAGNSGRLLIRISSTTSLYQTNLITELLSDFKNATSLNADFTIIVRGSGEALRLLADGSTCIAFVHAPTLELQYINRDLVERLAIFAYNEFVIVGPPQDPANVSSAHSAVEAFRRIYEAGEKGVAKFISRGDMSGTHARELQLWRLAGVRPENKAWYLKSGQGMAQTLLMAENIGSYALTDIGTYLVLRGQGRLEGLVVLKKDPDYLLNVYSMYLSKAPVCNSPAILHVALRLRDYVMSRGQELLELKYSGVLNPVKGREDLVLEAWVKLASLGQS